MVDVDVKNPFSNSQLTLNVLVGAEVPEKAPLQMLSPQFCQMSVGRGKTLFLKSTLEFRYV